MITHCCKINAKCIVQLNSNAVGFSLTVSLLYFQFLAIILVIFIAEVSAFVLGFVYREKVNKELASLSQPKSKDLTLISRCLIIPVYLFFFFFLTSFPVLQPAE